MYLEKKARSDNESWSVDGELTRNIFMEKVCRKCALKASPRHLF